MKVDVVIVLFKGSFLQNYSLEEYVKKKIKMTSCVILPCLILSLISICLTLYIVISYKSPKEKYEVGRCSLDSFDYGPNIYSPYLPGQYYPKPSFEPGNCPCKSTPHKSLLSLPDNRTQPHF